MKEYTIMMYNGIFRFSKNTITVLFRLISTPIPLPLSIWGFVESLPLSNSLESGRCILCYWGMLRICYPIGVYSATIKHLTNLNPFKGGERKLGCGKEKTNPYPSSQIIIGRNLQICQPRDKPTNPYLSSPTNPISLITDNSSANLISLATPEQNHKKTKIRNYLFPVRQILKANTYYL
jgi:hypothetical protein